MPSCQCRQRTCELGDNQNANPVW
uniref:Uncharacterized protein n=1 Tax=Arundo donax TaxID=35708 RepID=A0A0A9BSN1_ARUDO